MALDRGMRAQAYANKARAEMDALDDAGVVSAGNALSPLALVKGEPGEAEKAGRPLLSGADGTALRAAFLALGYAPEDWSAVAAWSESGGAVDPALLRTALVALDPATLVALDESAAEAVRMAFAEDLYELADLEDALLAPGRVSHVAGMRVLNLGGFEAALASPHEKQVMWARLKQIPPLAEPY